VVQDILHDLRIKGVDGSGMSAGVPRDWAGI
jgi:hypothetical protein